MTQSNPPTPQSNKTQKQWIIENVISLGMAFLIMLMIRSSVIEAFKIPSGSMIPTLFVGDHIFVNKFAYGLKIPFSELVTGRPTYIIERDPPKRGDVIVFMFPKDEDIHYIKRVIGVPGDTIELRNKILYVNQKRVENDLVGGPQAEKLFKALDDPKYTPAHVELFSERLNSTDHMIFLNRTDFTAETFGPITVPPESLFVMGDNRDSSNDSRFWGFVPMKNVKGKAVVIWLSIWISLSEGQFVFRPDRTGTLIH